jgi:hypothetical protein
MVFAKATFTACTLLFVANYQEMFLWAFQQTQRNRDSLDIFSGFGKGETLLDWSRITV